jgi:O-antigen ligase
LLIIFKKYFEGRTKDKIIISLTCILIIFSLSRHDNISEGFKRAQENIIMWSIGEESHTTSAGQRLEMWSGSIEAFKDSPWLGHGYRSANTAVSEYTDPKLKETISAFTHLHNEYITNLISAGVVGLFSVLLLLFLPLKIFINNINNKNTFFYSFMGVILCSSYSLIGMTHIAFGEEHVNAFYIFFLAILLPKVIKESNSPGVDQPKAVHIAN